ncbi:unnamed protein product [Rotaria sordida]|uniref:Peptidase M28 domain-containing protein n=1 Tax=Rotaria sordida TaxID=392033 RepID=A0A815F9Z0_9BILA|nr:unnamed protein product [Rotaria sordida]CAF1326314.1 unnamed protein product [Rotaria sordida]CAF1423763.1 unnamed protein product [Rotaria sordida]CAF3853196.1 unnamed protein product [Rotaria sordida]
MIELWPSLGAFGFYTWVYARIFCNDTHWIWLNSSSLQFPSSVDSPLTESEYPEPYLPQLLITSNPDHRFEIFADILLQPSLYMKPVFGDCLWTSTNYTNSLNQMQTTTIYSGWLPPEKMNEFEQELHHNICVLLPQPFHVNGKPYTLFINITQNNSFEWPSNISWYTVPSPSSNDILKTKPVSDDWYNDLQWTKSFANQWKSDMYRFSAVQPLEYENTTQIYLTRKSSIQTDNQLMDLIDYLIERYNKLNIRTEKQIFHWRNITQANLIAYIPASGSYKCHEPVVFIDHIDTAFEGDTFANTGKRRSTPGADDNVSGLMALLQSASILKKTQENACRDIWLVHLTGEEYPAASLGITHFLQQLFIKKQPIHTAVIVDMIGHRVNRSDPIVQVNAGDTTKSLLMAELALNYVYPRIKNDLILQNLQPVLRRWSDPFAYLYNTDGVRFVEYGFTCLLFNEHINYHENFDRDGYHDTLDTVDFIDFEYGQTVSQYAIATVAMLAHSDCRSDSCWKEANLIFIIGLSPLLSMLLTT